MDLNSVRAVEFVDESAFDLAHTLQVCICTTILVLCVCVWVWVGGGGCETPIPGKTRGVTHSSYGGIIYQCFPASSQALKPCKSTVTIYGDSLDWINKRTNTMAVFNGKSPSAIVALILARFFFAVYRGLFS